MNNINEYMFVSVEMLMRWRDAFAVELDAWDIDPPLQHVKTSHDEINAILRPVVDVVKVEHVPVYTQPPVADVAELVDVLRLLLDTFDRCEAGFAPEVERRFAVRDTARATLYKWGEK